MPKLDEKTEIAAQQIALYLNDLLKDKGLKPQDLINSGINPKQVYSVLRIGQVERPDYQFSTLIKVLSAIGVHLEIHSLNDKNNFTDELKKAAN